LLDDVDFAWAFHDHAEVVSAAGHHVAAEWLRIRASDEQGLMHLASETVAAVRGEPASSSARPLRAVTRPYAKAKKRPGRSTGRTEAAPAPSALHRRVDALTKVFVQAGLARPSGTLSRALEGERRDTCRRQAQIKASHAEEATVVRVVKTWGELTDFMRKRARPMPPSLVDLETFIHKGTMGASRALQGLKWLNKQGNFGWPLEAVEVPPERKRKLAPSQAVVVEPPMLSYLEEQIQKAQGRGDESWTALGAGVVRYRHVQRSVPVRISLSTVHCWCPKGKQRRSSNGFHWCVPGTFTTGWAGQRLG
jgi:hypothetical protein